VPDGDGVFMEMARHGREMAKAGIPWQANECLLGSIV
jgi:hypothetical protein